MFLKKLARYYFVLALFLVSSLFCAGPVEAASTTAKTSIVTLNPNSKYATPLYIIDSGKPGPVVLIVGGVHGNEPAGYKAADTMKSTRISSGKLLVIPRANIIAVERNTRYISGEKDLNRAFPTSKSVNPSYKPALAIYKVVKDYDVDWVMDMHEGYGYKNLSSTSVGQSLIYYPDSQTTPMAAKLLKAVNSKVSISSHKFVSLRYPVQGSLARSSAQYLGANSFIFETCTKDKLSTRINYHVLAANTLLEALDMK